MLVDLPPELLYLIIEYLGLSNHCANYSSDIIDRLYY